MDNGLMEIIVKLDDEDKPRRLNFEELFEAKDRVESIMLLWTANSYFVDVKHRRFLINGGRNLDFPRFDKAKLMYRKRTAETVSTTGAAEGIRREVSWILGMENGDGGELVFLVISETGAAWRWENKL